MNFPTTRGSVVERLRGADPAARTAAFGELVAGYWKPIYKYLRLKWNLDESDAEDVTQGFLALAWEKGYFDGFDPAKARFRTFLRVCVDRYVMKQREADAAQRRGGGAVAVPLDFPGAERELAGAGATAALDVDALFRQELVRDLFARSLADVKAECERTGKGIAFQVFESYDVDPADGVTYSDLATRYDVPVTQVTNYLAAVRRLFRARALEHLRTLTATDEEFRAEARDLFGIDVG